MTPHQHFGLHRIRQLGSDSHFACDFQTLLVIQPARLEDSLEQQFEESSTPAGSLTYALTLVCEPCPIGLHLHGAFDSKCIPKAAAERLLSQMGQVLTSLIFEGHHKIDVLRTDDKNTLVTWQRDPLQPDDGRVEDQILSFAQQAPEARAVDAWDGTLTFDELEEKSAILADDFKRHGMGPGMMVPVCFEKSVWYIAVLLAVMRTGAAFVPIDPAGPVKRVQAILAATKSFCLLTSVSQAGPSRAKVPAEMVVYRIPLDLSGGRLTEPDPLWGEPVLPVEALYVLFTSGSTGVPKGVIVTHAAMKASLQSHGSRLGLSKSSRVLQFSSHTFDVSLLEILTTLSFGGCICIPSDDDRLDRLSGYIREADVNFAILTPSVARIISPATAPGLRTLALAGEGWGQEIIEVWGSSVRLFNAYGPTEATILSIIGEVDAHHFRANNIGSGCGALCWITSPADPSLLVPIGSVGELLLEGPILAWGYLDDELKTREAFIDPPAWRYELSSLGAPPCRSTLYRTGDLARYEEDGSITYVGRLDSQIKIRGQRVELSEIEHHILASGLVQNVMVSVFKNDLVSVVSLKSASHSSGLSSSGSICRVPDNDCDAALRICETIREDLVHKVPEYMVPRLWVPVIALPLSSSAKVARKVVNEWLASQEPKHLTERIHQTMTDSLQSDATISAVEGKIQRVWMDALQLPEHRITLDATFAGLGGDSIIAMLVVAKLRTLGLSATMRDILQTRSIRELASRMDFTATIDSPLDPEQLHTLFDLTPIQRFFFDFFPQGANHFNQSILVRVARHFKYEQWITAVHTLVQHHSMLRARFSNVDGRFQQRITDDVEGSCHIMFHALRSMDTSAINQALARREESIDVVNGPVCAVEIFNFAQDQIIFITAHHLIMDFVSQRIILRDLEDLLAGSNLSATLPLSFQAWAQAQIDYGSRLVLPPVAVLPHLEDVPLANLNYWGIASMTNLYGDSTSRVVEFNETVTSSLMGPANRAFDTELIELFIAALLHSFVDAFEDRSPPAVFNEGHGREPWDTRLDPSSTVGWFTTITPIALPASSSPRNFDDTVRRTKDIRRAIPANGFEYFMSRFCSEAGSSAFRDHAPVMEILLNYAGIFNEADQHSSIFSSLAPEEQQQPTYNDINLQLKRFALFDVYALIANGRLSFTFAYSPSLDHQGRIATWITNFQHLLGTASSSLPKRSPERTLSDLPRARLDYQELGRLDKDIRPSLYPALVDDVWECSSTQAMMLRAQLLGSRFFSPYFVWEITGKTCAHLQRSRLSEAWRLVVARHSVLRSVFTNQLSSRGIFHQIILAGSPLSINWVFAAEGESAIEALRHLRPLPFDDMHLPYRLTACEDADSRILCRLDISHALIDHVAINIIFSDLIASYGGNSVNIDRPALGFGDYIAYSHLHAPEKGTLYWQECLHEARPCLLNREHQQTCQGILSSKTVPVDAPVLKYFCATLNITSASFFQACWALLLQHYLGTDDVLFGYIASNRGLSIPGIDKMVGPLISVLPRRLHLPRTSSSLAERVQTLAKNINDRLHDDLEYHLSAASAMEEVVRRDGAARDLLFPFDTAVNFRNGSSAVDPVSSDSPLSFKLLDAQDPMPLSMIRRQIPSSISIIGVLI
ncbi:Nonribosomal peptide synthetase 8 [Hypocenomyce scalaris]|nr:Nonribosomal peptide synthetase 8 [Hypocenomyce scalaris]